MIGRYLNPFEAVGNGPLKLLAIGQAAILLALWCLSPASLLPTPVEIFRAWDEMAKTQGLLHELLVSVTTIWIALFWSTLITMVLTVLATTAAFKAPVRWLTGLRFLGFAGVTFMFTLMTSTGAELKIWLLTFGMTCFLLTNMLAVVGCVTQEEIDYGRTMNMSGWHLTYEVVLRGRMDEALDLIRQNAAIGWTLLSMVEGLVRSEGGIGTLLLNQNKHLHLAAVFAIQLTILYYGIMQDFGLRYLRSLICPWVKFSTVRE